MTSAPQPRRHTLLIVDDEEGPRQSLRVIFKDDYNLLLAGDGPSAVVLAQKNFPLRPAAATPCAISAVFHSVIGSLLAAYWRRRLPKSDPQA